MAGSKQSVGRYSAAAAAGGGGDDDGWLRYERAQKRFSYGVGRTFKRNTSGHGSLLGGLIAPFQLKDLAAWKQK